MKKAFLFIILIVLSLTSFAAAEPIDLSGMSFDELVDLRDRLNLAIWNSQEWQEVTVPAGIWKVGEDIPAGHWTIKPFPGDLVLIDYCSEVNTLKRRHAAGSSYHTQYVLSETRDDAYQGVNQYDIILEEGWYFINDAAVIFTPYAGKTDLGFQ